MPKKAPKTREQPPRRSAMPLVVAVMLVAAVAAIALISRRPEEQVATAPPPVAQSQAPPAEPPAPTPPSTPEAAAPPALALSPSWPADLPPLPFVGYPPPRPRDVVQAVYQFAYRHPEVLDYVPCFCGCERDGHVANTDCFVKSRDGGRVTWDDHGLT